MLESINFTDILTKTKNKPRTTWIHRLELSLNISCTFYYVPRSIVKSDTSRLFGYLELC